MPTTATTNAVHQGTTSDTNAVAASAVPVGQWKTATTSDTTAVASSAMPVLTSIADADEDREPTKSRTGSGESDESWQQCNDNSVKR